MRRIGLAAVAVIVASALAVASPAWAASQLIKDGGFEKPVVAPGTFVGFNTGQSFNGWTVVGASGNVDVISGTFTQNGFKFPAHSGKQWIDLTGVTQTATGVAQTITTAAGTHYVLTFWVGNVYNPGGIFGVSSTVNVLINGVQSLAATNSAGKGKTTQVWKKFTFGFTASSAATTISFINGDPPNDTLNGLDAASLVAG